MSDQGVNFAQFPEVTATVNPAWVVGYQRTAGGNQEMRVPLPSVAAVANAVALATAAATTATGASETAVAAASQAGTSAVASAASAAAAATSEANAAATLAGAVKTVDLAAAATVAMMAYTAAEAQSILDNALPLQSYTALRAYTGRSVGVRLTGIRVAGFFWRDASDTTSADNGGTVIVDASARRWKRLFVGPVDAFWFGAVGDNTADDTAALNSLGVYTAANKLTAVLTPTALGYKTSDTVTFPVGAILDMTGAIINYTGPKDRPALVLGTLGALNLRPVYRGIAVAQIGTLSWPTLAHVGVRCINSIRGDIDIRYVANFTVPWECYSDTQGYAYTKHRIQELLNGQYQMVLRTVGPTGNFVNENIFIGGRYGCDSTANALGSRYGVLLTWDKVSSYRAHNANRWEGPCFELQNPSSGEAVAMIFDGAGGYNRVVEARRESGIGPFARLDGGNQAFMTVNNNKFSVIYGASANAGFIRGLEEINGANGNRLEGDPVLKRDPIAWTSGRVVDLVSGYGTNRPYIGGQLFFITNGAPTPVKWIDSSFIKTFKDEVYLINGVGVGTVLDTSKVKRFNIGVAARVSRGRIALKCFDAAGQLLVPGSAASPYVMVPGNQLAAVATFGGNCYGNQSDTSSNEYEMTFADVVQKVWVIFTGGTNPLLLESFFIQGFPDFQNAAGTFVYAPMTMNSGVPGSENQAFARAKPDTEAQHGVYKRGQTVFNGVAAVGAPSHWTAITNDVGYLNKPWVASTAYAFTGEIVINGANAYVCVTAGTSDASGGPTGTGTAIADNTVVWDYLGPKAVFATSANLA